MGLAPAQRTASIRRMSGHVPNPDVAGTLAFAPPFARKLCPREQLRERLAQLPRPMVFTNGVFDVLHVGHATYLAQARGLGASLVVALNTDASARRLGKGPDRPLNTQRDRALMLAALESIDLVTWFDEETPLELIRQIRPDRLVKGGDYDMDRLAESQLVRGYGGEALSIPLVAGHSTTALVKRIRNRG
jgi:rfaE bifunctional protein nucleotidyltransferase chain/domain